MDALDLAVLIEEEAKERLQVIREIIEEFPTRKGKKEKYKEIILLRLGFTGEDVYLKEIGWVVVKEFSVKILLGLVILE